MRKRLKNHFIPHVDNNYRPHVLQKAAMVAMLFLVVVSFTLANLQALFWINIDWMVSTVLPAVVVSETNEERVSDNLVSLSRNTVLDKAAQLKADDMAKNGYFAHYSPTGVSPWYWFHEADYRFVHAGENLAVHFSDSNEVVKAWMKSPTHRANIMNGKFTEIGIGVAEGSFEGYRTIFVVQLFGTPAVPLAAITKPTPTPVSNPVTVVTEQVSETPVFVSESETQQVASAEESVLETTEAEPTTVAEATPVEEEFVANEDELAILPATIEETSFEAVDNSMYSNMITSSTNEIAASVDSSMAGSSSQNKPIMAFVTQPHLVLQILYITIGMFVFLALLLSILIEMRRQQPMQIAYGTGLMAVMLALFYIHSLVTAGAVIA